MSIRKYQGVSPTIHNDAWVDESAVVIGNVDIAEHSSVWPCSVLRGDINTIEVGAYTNIQDGSILHVNHESEYAKAANLKLGNYVTVGHACVLHGCQIGNFCLIGMGATVLDNVQIEDYVMIGANSLVPANKKLESGYLYLGSPVKQVRKLRVKEKEFLRYSAENYARLKDNFK